MKKVIALLLCLGFLLSACSGAQEEPLPAPAPSGPETPVDPAPVDPAPVDPSQIEALVLRLADLPQLPEQPDLGSYQAALDALDYQKLGAEKYQEESQKLSDDFYARQEAYSEALRSLRGDGVDAGLTDALLAYTGTLGPALLTDRALSADGGKNAVFSPANLYLALCMLAGTTDGESRGQILALLGLDSAEAARSVSDQLWRTLWNESASGKTLLANSIWLNEKMTYHEDTVAALAEGFRASSFRAPMGVKSTDEAVAAWINDNTGHLLEQAAGAVQTTPDTLLLLISALYFKSQWSEQFYPAGTYEDVFTNAQGAEERVDFMHQTFRHSSYLPGEGCKIASLGFRDGMSMRFLLPDEGVTLESVLNDPDTFDAFLRGDGEAVPAKVIWSVPKFDVDCDIDLIPFLQRAGITDVFDAGLADFSPLTDTPAVVSGAKHAARVKVDEEGCEAAAFTVIMAEATAAITEELPEVEMNLNRPFAFLITGADGLPLFLAAVNTVNS